jgi:hypothetical protein
MASGVFTDVSGNNFAGIDDSSAWTFSAASLSTVQLPALSMLIALIKVLLTVCTLSVEKNLISEIDKPVILFGLATLPVTVAVDNSHLKHWVFKVPT